MSTETAEEEIIITGGLLSLTLFQEKLMRNFFVINNKIKKLQSLNQLDSKTRNIQKELKFLTMKVDTIVQKLPKDGNSITKKDVQHISKEQLFQLLNNSQDKLKETVLIANMTTEIQKVRSQIKNTSNHRASNHAYSNSQSSLKQGVNSNKASFTAGQVLNSQPKKISKQTLKECLDSNEMKIMDGILQNNQYQNSEIMEHQNNEIQQMKNQIQDLYKIIQSMKVGRGYQHFAQKQQEYYEQKEQFQSKEEGSKKLIKEQQRSKDLNKDKQSNRQLNTNLFEKRQKQSKQLKQVKQQKETTLIGQVSNSLSKESNSKQISFLKPKEAYGGDNQGFDLKKAQIVKQDVLARKTSYQPKMNNISPSIIKQQSSTITGRRQTKLGQLTKVQYIPQNKLVAKRSNSMKKLDRIQRKLKVDDIKDLNSVLKEVQFRLQSKVSIQNFTNIIQELEEKLQILRVTKDPTNELNDVRKMIYSLDSKLQYIISYLQSTNQDDALIVKKHWTCISCDKNIQKFNGKVGQHLNWDSINSKKISPTKVGAFGQTGQLASKIKNLMQSGE